MKLKEQTNSSGMSMKFLIAVVLIGLLMVILFFSQSPKLDVSPSKTLDKFIPQTLELQIPEVNFKKIKAKREEALERGLLFSSSEDTVDGSLRISDETKPIRLRLKGDLLDHLQGDKWSYRIQLKNGQEWNHMQTFSIHNSGARSHLAEWLLLQLFRQEGIMTPNYDFVHVEENGSDKGVYAYEQFFDNSLLQQNQRPIGPILKHADDAYWENVQKNITPFYWTKVADVELMNTENKNDPSFMVSFQQAKSKLQGYLDGNVQLEDVFDVDKLAKYYALMEISHAYHAQQLTNIRFYYNPLTAKLEPIAYDCFGTSLPAVTKDWSAAGEGQLQHSKPRQDYPNGGVYMYKLFQDSMMTARYLEQLYHYSSEEFINQTKNDWQSGINQREKFIQTDKAYQDYSFSFDELFKKAKWTRQKLLPLPAYSLNIQVKLASRGKLVCSSYHYFPIELVGLGDEVMEQQFSSPIYLGAYHPDHAPDSKVINNPNNYRRVYFKTIGIDSIFTEEINRLSLIPQKLDINKGDLSFIDKYECIKMNGTNIEFGPCNIALKETVLIPKEYSISIKAGTVIQLLSGVNLISFSPINANGSKTELIRIEGANNNGILLSQADSKSRFNHVVFNGLGQIADLEYQSNSAVTIYKSDVDFYHTEITNSESKNALSVQHSTFNILDFKIEGSPGNGIALAYSSGKISELTIENVNSDGMQLYGTSVRIDNASFDFIKGTAINSDQSTSTELSSIEVNDCYRAFKITDSQLNVDAIRIENVEEGIYAVDQNEAVGLTYTNAVMVNVQYPYLIGGKDFFYWNGYRKKAQ